MYGIGAEYLRIPDKEFKYWKNGKYVFVDHGYFDTRNVLRPMPIGLLLIVGHILYAIGVYTVLSQKLWLSWIVNFWYGTWGGLAVTGGVHRLWCHKSYQAKTPLRIFLMLGQTMTWQYTLYTWSIGHRVHHKYSDTDADPHSTKRGFFFAHIGWVFRKEHPDVSTKERLYDYSDLLKDPVVVFQHKYYYQLLVITSIIVPITLQMTICGDTLWQAFLLSVVMRNISVFHDTAFVNSAAHMFGDRPYNDKIDPRENYYVALASFGEGYHNYHHSYPWDYRAAETHAGFNLTSVFINLMAMIGQAYNLRIASPEVIQGSKDRVIKESIKQISDDESDNNQHSIPRAANVASNEESLNKWAREVIKSRKLAEKENIDIINYAQI